MRMRHLLLLVTTSAFLAASCRSSHSDDGSHLGNTSNEIPENVRQKLPVLANSGKYDEALNLLRPYAERGNPEAQFEMAVGLVLKGNGTNDSEIVWWARKAATQDYPQALGFLAHAYQWGEYGLPTNNVMVAMWTSAETNATMIKKCLDYERKELKTAK